MNMAYLNKVFGHTLNSFDEVVKEAKQWLGDNILLEDYYCVVFY